MTKLFGSAALSAGMLLSVPKVGDALWPTLITALLCYLIGSLNSGVIISRFYGGDVREHGSGNAGSTNMLRTYGKTAAALTYIGDLAKGVICVLLGRQIFLWFGVSGYGSYIGAYAVLLGHIFPLYFGFRGGKGVAAAMGVLLASDPIAFLVVAVIFVPIVPISGYVSLAAILGAIGYPIVTWIHQYLRGSVDMTEIMLICGISLLLLYMHRENIKRLLSGTENAVFKKSRSRERK